MVIIILGKPNTWSKDTLYGEMILRILYLKCYFQEDELRVKIT